MSKQLRQCATCRSDSGWQARDNKPPLCDVCRSKLKGDGTEVERLTALLAEAREELHALSEGSEGVCWCFGCVDGEGEGDPLCSSLRRFLAKIDAAGRAQKEKP